MGIARADTAIVHDYFLKDGGAEQVALELARMFPDAPVYTSLFDEDRFGDLLSPRRVRPWPLQRVIGTTPYFRRLLPLYLAYFSALRIPAERLVISSSVSLSKAVRSGAAIHVAYIHTPMRYAWDLESYLADSSFSGRTRAAARLGRPLLTRWDRWTAARPTHLVANSATVRDRIRRHWGRDAVVIHPPVDTDQFRVSSRDDGYLLIAARQLAYRRVDLAVRACTASGRRLVVVGDGPERKRLESLAGPTIKFVGQVTRSHLVDLFERCRAYLVPGVEDFGIAPVEAMAAGKPVVAFGRGGATETVVDGQTGIFFDRSDDGLPQRGHRSPGRSQVRPGRPSRPGRGIRRPAVQGGLAATPRRTGRRGSRRCAR